MNFLYNIDKTLINNVFIPIVKNSKWSQFTWARICIALLFIYHFSLDCITSWREHAANQELQNKIIASLLLNTLPALIFNWLIFSIKSKNDFVGYGQRLFNLVTYLTFIVISKSPYQIVVSVLIIFSLFYFLSDLSEPTSDNQEDDE